MLAIPNKEDQLPWIIVRFQFYLESEITNDLNKYILI